MNPSGILWRRVSLALLATFCLLVLSTAVLAQEGEAKEEPAKGPAYVGAYSLVILCVGGGTFLACRSAGRHAPKEKRRKMPSAHVGGDDADGEKKKDGPASRTKQVSQEAKTALTISIAGIVPVVGLFIGGFGLWKSIQAKKIVARNKLLSGEGIALAGIIVGAVMIVVQIVVTVLIVMSATS